MHRNGTRLLAALVGLVALLGAGGAQASMPHTCELPAVVEQAALSCAADADPQAGEGAASVTAITDEATSGVGGDVRHTGVEEATETRGFFAWLSLSFELFVVRLAEVCGLAGQDAPATDGALDLRLGTDGIDLDGGIGPVDLADTPLGEAEAQVDGALGDAGTHMDTVTAEVEGLVPVILG